MYANQIFVYKYRASVDATKGLIEIDEREELADVYLELQCIFREDFLVFLVFF